jgi:hypothetical protein
LVGVDTFLSIYLNDQLAMGVLWRELARRAQRNNRGTPAEAVLAQVGSAIAEDVETFRNIMRQLRIRPNPAKTGLAVAAERLGRLKPNGRLIRYSPLSRFTELEILVMGIEAKKQLWATLRDLADLGRRLPGIDFGELIERAEHQRTALDPLRLRAGRDAFGTATPK